MSVGCYDDAMRVFLVCLALCAVACDSAIADDVACGPSYPCGERMDATLADVHVRDAIADAVDGGCGGQCHVGQICSFDPGCASPTKSCHPDTGGDAVALVYCACDGHEFTTSQLFPTQSYSNAGRCMNDAGDAGDAADGD